MRRLKLEGLVLVVVVLIGVEKLVIFLCVLWLIMWVKVVFFM